MARSVRYEFGKQVRRDANARSEGRCEAVGTVYGLEPGQRCNAVFKGRAKEFDHYPVPATEKPIAEEADHAELNAGHDGPLGQYVAYDVLCAARQALGDHNG
jgi:hypothetical protein